MSSGQGAWLIYLDNYHPRWQVTVDGFPKKIVPANLAFKAVYLEQGAHEVRFAFTGGSYMSRIYVRTFWVLGILSTTGLFGGMCWICLPGSGEMFRRKFRLPRNNLQKNDTV